MATGRYGVRTTDTGAVLVQELIGTRAVEDVPDLLAERESARAWWDESVRGWAAMRGVTVPAGALSDEDVAALRELRATFDALLARDGNAPAVAAGVTVTLALGDDGLVRPVPTGDGSRWLASALWSETLLAQQTDVWSRIKLCRNEDCRTAFYDSSRNRSGVWHDVTTCGNVANLRASRERKRRRSAVTD